jgi:hypothetical protein
MNRTHTGRILPLTAVDIGIPGSDPREPGMTVPFDEVTFDSLAGGSTIWGTQDAGHFVYESRTGDFDLRVRLERQTTPNQWTKSGLMARPTLTRNSRFVYLFAQSRSDAKWIFLDGESRVLELTIQTGLDAELLLEGTASFDGNVALFPRGTQLLGAPIPSGAGMIIRAFAEPGSQLVLEASANLEIWEAVSEPVEADGSVLEILDASSQSAPHRFYRLREVE